MSSGVSGITYVS